MRNWAEVCQEVDAEGFAVLQKVFNLSQIRNLLASIEEHAEDSHRRRCGGTRNLLNIPAVRELALSGALRTLVGSILGSEWRAVRAILFDKVPTANWKVPWHQDLSIAVRERAEMEGFGPWSVKAGIPHVQPPITVLEQMLAVRIHLDECDATNGPLRVIPRSHTVGRIPERKIEEYTQERSTVCQVPEGGVLLMRPLLLHASSPSESPDHRRVIHIEYCAARLPSPLSWHSDLSPGEASSVAERSRAAP